MSRSLVLYLDDIIGSCAKVQRYLQGMALSDFMADERTFDAVVRNLEIIGEAAKQVPQDTRDRYPNIEWRKLAGLRDILAHAYFSLESEILWDVAVNKLPDLQQQVEQIRRETALD